ncbi:MAG TPA: bifunctional diaminohydroxyphosphoribosylaminopyrimidine deaminase/5-amino-6-(5-phosphoribosylamino)uracil reductase RibD, partial [Gemmatimonadales bacterium]|nr:bifunctional diaminohydroxyphosphoribosylaminopyrimidine deaminase/5-amino-6-(5-phosphoribosylamino)uracil reductase RibD [Gemmatimonadales bacterium]
QLEAMRRALSLARLGWGRVHPNPMVGAVVLAEDTPAGEGFHAEYGREHAEVLALRAAGPRARGATLVVTLTPCGHTGKQPPCAEAIIAAGIRRVVAAASDPNPQAAGGVARLRAAGIEVDIGLLRCDAERQNAIFFHQFRNRSRPWVALKLATSLDHRIADGTGESRWISGEPARAFVHGLRAGFDLIGVGGRTALRDDPRLTARGAIEPRAAQRRVVFEGADPLPDTLALFSAGKGAIVVTARDRAAETRHRLRGTGATILPADGLAEALSALRRSGVMSLLVEGGGRLAGGLLREGLVDRFYWIQSPLWLGDSAVPATAGWSIPALTVAERWSVVERRGLGGDTLLVLDREPCSPAS